MGINRRAILSIIPDQQVRAAAQHMDRDAVFVTAGDDPVEFGLVARLQKVLRRAAEVHPSQRGQRLIVLQDVAEFVE